MRIQLIFIKKMKKRKGRKMKKHYKTPLHTNTIYGGCDCIATLCDGEWIVCVYVCDKD